MTKRPIINLDALLESLAADVLSPDYPIELVEQELREAGIDPEEIARDSEALVRKLLAERSMEEGISPPRLVASLSRPQSEALTPEPARAEEQRALCGHVTTACIEGDSVCLDCGIYIDEVAKV